MKKLLYLTVILILSSCSVETEKQILAKLNDIPFGLKKEKARLLRDDQTLVTVPYRGSKKLPLLFVFGGLYYANPSFMSQQIPSYFYDDAVIVFAPCTPKGGLPYNLQMERVKKLLKKEGITVKNITVCGFSAGGPDALAAIDKDIKVIGLIDPNPEIPQSTKAKAQIITAFNKSNWHDNSPELKISMTQQFNNFAKWAKGKGAIVEENSVAHETFPKYFFYKYRNSLFK